MHFNKKFRENNNKKLSDIEIIKNLNRDFKKIIKEDLI